MKISKKTAVISLAVLSILTGTGAVLAGFVDKGEVLGSKFSVGSADLKMVINIGQPPESTNLADELSGPSFSDIGPSWTQDYLIKLYNNGTGKVQIASNSNYETINDPDELRQIIFVEPFAWNDANLDGIADTDEIGVSYGRKTIVKWKTEGYSLGELDTGQTKGLILRFSTDSVSDTKQGKSALFDFVFDSIQMN